ncbi:hypothetical protein BGY98DRAFT_1047300, partial [Russula aff. rugulosa BPL654]
QEYNVDSSRSCNTLADFIKSTFDVHAGTPTRARCTGLINRPPEDTRGRSSHLYSVKSLEKLGLHADLPKGI